MQTQKMQSAAQQVRLWQGWQDFWQTGLAGKLLAVEQQAMQEALVAQRGYHLLNLSSCAATDWLQDSGIRHQIHWRPQPCVADHPQALVSSPIQLPLESDSMDCVVLHHLLELVTAPHQLLKEAARVTLPKGELILLGFNPVSLWGVCHLLPKMLRGQALRSLGPVAPITLSKLHDWLAFLDLELIDEQQLFHRLPWQFDWLQRQLARWDGHSARSAWPLGAAYCLRIRKRIGCPLGIRQTDKNTGWLPVGAVSSPTRSSLKKS